MPVVNLLGWHGTVLRVEHGTGMWFHARPFPDDDGAEDLALDLPDSGLDHAQIIDWFVAEPATRSGCICLQRDGKYLTADPARPFVHFASSLPGPQESFRPIRPAILSRLRALLSAPARIAETGVTVHPALADKFHLHFDGRDHTIWEAELAEDGLVFAAPTGPRTLLPLPSAVPRRRALPGNHMQPHPAADLASFHAAACATLLISDAEEFALPPTTLSDADQVWMQQKPWYPERQFWGRRQPRCEIARAANVFVLTSPGQEGTIFDADGLYTESLYLDSVPLYGTEFLQRHGRRVFIEEAALQAAPVLEGPHAVFYGGLVANYYHWVIEALLPLGIMAPHLPPGTSLLLPLTLAEPSLRSGGSPLPSTLGMLDDFGFGAMNRSVVGAPVCRAADLFWLRNLNLDSLPAAGLIRVRDQALSVLPGHGAEPGRRLYIRRPGKRRVANAREVEDAVTRLGFTVHELAGLPPRDQMALFRDAHCVIAPHGADLANLLFCAPGTKVIELTPDVQFRPFYGHISDKLRLSHAVLPCRVSADGFDGDIHVDPARLTALFKLMQERS